MKTYPLLTMYNTPHAGYFATFLCRRPWLAARQRRAVRLYALQVASTQPKGKLTTQKRIVRCQ